MLGPDHRDSSLRIAIEHGTGHASTEPTAAPRVATKLPSHMLGPLAAGLGFKSALGNSGRFSDHKHRATSNNQRVHLFVGVDGNVTGD